MPLRRSIGKKKAAKKRVALELETELERVLALRATDVTTAEAELRSLADRCRVVAKSGPCKEESLAVGRLCQYYLALLLNANNARAAEADRYLDALGYRYKLAPEAFAKQEGCASSEVCVAEDGLLSTDLVTRLQTAFASDSPFWRDHGYPCGRFFSYSQRLGAEGRTVIDDLIGALASRVSSLPWVKEDLGTAEWWAHCREHSAEGHQLHFDTDEGAGQVAFPACSTVIYLSEGVSTLVTDQRYKEGPASQGWLVPASVGRVCFFDGRQLHGVLPCAGFAQRRITVMIGWWPKSSRAATACCKPYAGVDGVGPMMQLPGEEFAFVQHLKRLHVGSAAASLASTATSNDVRLGHVKPVWLPVSSDSAEVAFEDRGAVVLHSLFFLRSLDDVDHALTVGTTATPSHALEIADMEEECMSLEEARALAASQAADMQARQASAADGGALQMAMADEGDCMSLEEARALAASQASEMQARQASMRKPKVKKKAPSKRKP